MFTYAPVWHTRGVYPIDAVDPERVGTIARRDYRSISGSLGTKGRLGERKHENREWINRTNKTLNGAQRDIPLPLICTKHLV